MKKIALVAALACSAAFAAAFSQDEEDAAGRFKWSWENGDAGDGGAGGGAAEPAGVAEPAGAEDDRGKPAAGVDGLRGENAELRKLNEDLKLMNADLMAKIRSAELDARKPAGGDDFPEHGEVLERNVTLTKEVERLRAELDKREKAAADENLSAVMKGSDLFKDMLQKNVALQKELAVARDGRKKAEEAAEKDREAGRLLKAKAAEQEKLLDKLLSDNRELKAHAVSLEEQNNILAAAKQALEDARSQLERREAMLAAKDREMKRLEQQFSDRFGGIAEAEKKAEVFEKEKTDLFFNLGSLYTKVGSYAEAEKQFLAVLKVEPEAADAHYNLGILYDKHLKDRRKAMQHYGKFLQLDPKNPDAEKVRLWLIELEMRR